MQDPQQNLNERCFSGTVRAQEPENFPAFDFQIDLAKRFMFTPKYKAFGVDFGKLVNVNGGCHRVL
jgi:hypothetical protein